MEGFCFPLAMLFISDLILHQTVFKTYGNGFLYKGWYWVYGAFALMTIVGRTIKKVTITVFCCPLWHVFFIHWIDYRSWCMDRIENLFSNAGGFVPVLKMLSLMNGVFLQAL
jgi:hypothetical protein